MELKIYEHKAQYYETDQMGIIHHANYLHWFEEARIDMMEQMGMGYDIMEKQGIISPVVLVQMKEYNGIRMTLEYTVFDKETGAIRCVGESRHCFLTRDGKPVSLKRNYIEMDRAFREYSEQGQKEE